MDGMFNTLEVVMRVINGLFAIGLSPFLFQIYRRIRRRFYLLWGVGFLLYGIGIITRVGTPLTTRVEPILVHWLSFLFSMSGFINIITGIGDLIDKARSFLSLALFLPFIPILIYVVSGPNLIGWSMTLSPFLLIALSLIFIWRKYKASVDLFIVGWLLLLLINVAIPLNMINPGYIEILAIFGKMIIFIGMINPRFSFLEDDLKRYLISGIPEVYPTEISEHLTLLHPKSGQKTQEIEWIREKVTENSLKAIRTIMVTLYDLISPSDLKSIGITEKELYSVRILSGGRSLKQIFKEDNIIINDDMTQFEILLSEIMNYSNEKRVLCDIIVYTLSWIIHTHGWKRVYSLLISKISDLKASNVHIYCFYYPDTHENRAEITKFERLADKIIKI